MESQVRLQVRSAAEALFTDITLVWLLPSVDQVVLLQVGQLCETLGANIAFKWSLS